MNNQGLIAKRGYSMKTKLDKKTSSINKKIIITISLVFLLFIGIFTGSSYSTYAQLNSYDTYIKTMIIKKDSTTLC